MRKKEKKSRKKNLLEMRDYAQEEFDKLIVYLNSGALILTIGFVKDEKETTSDRFDDLTSILNWTSFFSFMIGIILFIIFITNNL